ncbi:MAG: MFS transporter [Oscillospiraceae bacterium]|nr:MFS transporter [Oscillospiraceae bacterium]
MDGTAAANKTGDITQQTKYVSFKEQMAFNFSAFFRDMSYAVMGMANYFYMDVLGLEGFKLAFLQWAQKLWDGINDPLMGAYFDRRSYKDEKARRFFKTTGIPVAILLALMFSPVRFGGGDNLNTWLRMVFILLLYIPFEAMHTINGTAYMSYYNSITPNIQERSGIISRARLFSSCGSAVVGGLIPILLSSNFMAKDDVRAKSWVYLGSAVLVAACFVVYNALMYTGVRERILSPPQPQQKILGIFRSLLHNKLFLIMILSNTIGGLISAGNTSMYYYDYNIGDTIWLPIIGVAGFPSLILASWLTPKLCRRFEKRSIVLLCAVWQILNAALLLAVGYQSKVFLAFHAFLENIPGAMRGMLYWGMIADSVDYLEWRTGKRNDGSIYAIEGLMGKLIGAFGATSTAIILKIIKFQPNALQQTPETLRGLFVLPRAVGMVSTAVSVIPYFFYDLTRKGHARMIEELKERAGAQADNL